MNRCNCNPTFLGRIEEYDIPTTNYIISKFSLSTKDNRIENTCELKTKVICEYLDIINKLECGILSDLEFLLEEISLIDILDNG